jgi:hypothetical protein
MDSQPFGGEPVIHFENEDGRRGFLKYAALIGVGATLAAACGNCSTSTSST